MATTSQLQSDEEILTTVSQRASAGLVFTRLGGVVLCLNPQRPVAQLYGREERLRHLRALDRQLPPHIYELGARALASLAADGDCQSVVFTGVSGAGKTFLAQRLLQRLCAGAAGASALEGAAAQLRALDYLGSAAAAAAAASPRRPAARRRAHAPVLLPLLVYFRPDGRVAAARPRGDPPALAPPP